MNGTTLASSRAGNLHFYDPRVDERTPIDKEALSRKIAVQTTPISQLELSSSSVGSQYASVHGVVRLIKPITYVEDPTGSIVVSSHDQPALSIGDEVVISGDVSRQGEQLELRNGHVQILWSDIPAPPLLVTPDEAATGLQDGRLVLITGNLIRETTADDGSTILELSGGGETFRAIAAPSTFIRIPIVRPSSEVQVTGVIRTDSKFAGTSAFALLLSPTEDAVQVVREAPWWTTRRIIVAAVVVAMVVTLLAFGFHKFKERYLLQIMKERELLAHDLHDTVSQSLAGIGLQLSSVASFVSDQGTAREQVERARVMVRQSHEELRRSVTTLRHQLAAIGDLAYALEQAAQRLTAGGGIQVKCEVKGRARRLPVSVADCFFRVGQEAIANAVQHAHASVVAISLTYTDRTLRMQITDNGNGFAPDESASGHGIFGMKRRAEMIGARFEIVRERQGVAISLEKRLSHSSRLFDNLNLTDTHEVEL